MQALSTTHSLHMKIVYQSLAIPFRLDWTSVFFFFFVLFVFPVQVVTVLLYVDCEDQQSLCLAIRL